MIPPEYLNQIVTGDARELAQAIPDESVDLIFTDPVYDRIKDYRWLAETAVRVLKPDRACLAFCWIGAIPETHDAMRQGGLSYRWRLIVRPIWSKEFHGRLIVMTQECLWYEKGNSKLFQTQFDFQNSAHNGSYRVNGKNWGKGLNVLMRFVSSFTDANSVVFDPFTGGGTVPAACKMLGRNYIAFEIVPDTAEDARERVRNTQPPLFVLDPEQVGMELS